jgi:hypothetical protein
MPLWASFLCCKLRLYENVGDLNFYPLPSPTISIAWQGHCS